jgi:hypothetical protein
VLHEDRIALLGVLDEGLLVGLRYCRHESIYWRCYICRLH